MKLYTPEGEALRGQPWTAYPRPQFRREGWVNLNGEWEFTVSPKKECPEIFDRRIRVPFPPESLLSGVHETFPEDRYLFYRRTFTLPAGFRKDRVLLHFGAVDQRAAVCLNGTLLGEHTGGYQPFAFDITDHLQEENTLTVRVEDHLSDHVLPYGKQCRKRGGMWYTPVSGIWQTVWLESVPERYIGSLRIRTGEDYVEFHTQALDGTVTIETPEGPLEVPLKEGFARAELKNPRLWSPEDPYLYRAALRAGEDTVFTYFALRTLTIGRVDGIPRLLLNGKPYFFHGLLYQGYWSDGLFTPAAPECYEQDILAMKRLGFNTLRKHIKVEPEQFYYDCDRLGMIVFQDFVNNGDYSFLRDTALPTLGLKRRKDKHLHKDPKTRSAFLIHMEQTVEQLYNHPCVCYWTIFNEGWGQFDSTAAYRHLKALDPTRFVDSASGWFTGGESDVVSEHVYFKPFRPRKTAKPLILSEFGGYDLKIEGHAFNVEKEYGYRHFEDQERFETALLELYENEIVPAIPQGLCGAIYTQVSDVEDETNGLLTYDRKVTKVTAEPMQRLAEKLKI
ncbi:MAG: glycoside hydrolase family 2 [Oscillibacter sp.]|nr:glycoside hydrolase family 2 [Oscillibacter sp.]